MPLAPGNYESEISRNALKRLAKVDEMQALPRAHPKTQ